MDRAAVRRQPPRSFRVDRSSVAAVAGSGRRACGDYQQHRGHAARPRFHRRQRRTRVQTDAAHPGLAKTGLLSGSSYGRDKPTLVNRLTKWTWHLVPFMWLDIDEAIKPTLYAAVSQEAAGGTY